MVSRVEWKETLGVAAARCASIRIYTTSRMFCLHVRRTQDMAGDPFGLLLRQRIVFLGGEVS